MLVLVVHGFTTFKFTWDDFKIPFLVSHEGRWSVHHIEMHEVIGQPANSRCVLTKVTLKPLPNGRHLHSKLGRGSTYPIAIPPLSH